MYHRIRWTSEKIRQRLSLVESLVYRRRQPLPPFRYHRLEGPTAQPPVAPNIDDGGWQEIAWGRQWGEPNLDFVLRSRFEIPAEWRLKGPLALYLPIGEAGDFSHPEALVYIDGRPYAACDRHHQEIQLPPECHDGAPHSLALHGWTGGTQRLHFDASSEAPPASNGELIMRPCQIVQIDQGTRDFMALARVAQGVADRLHEDEPERAHLYNALDEAFRVLDTRDPLGEPFYASIARAHEALQEGIDRSGAPLDVEITAVGHAHIDVAWLWTLDQTRQKSIRTFRNATRLMEQFPAFQFTQSQPQLYDYVRHDDPDLFESIRQRVQEGRWEPIGGMWVEADCNLSGGESLARQFLLGINFFREHFGLEGDTSVLWLPDVFGYAWNLPQLIKEAGLQYFFTIKIGWSQYNRFPYDSFWWQGLDGTRVLTHFSPTKHSGDTHASTYNATASPEEVLNSWTNFQQKDWGRPGVPPPLLMSYGHGDGGGGPTREMLENIREMGAFPRMPRVQCGTVAQFFEDLEARSGDRLPTWNGELYLEYHRGTYTTQAQNKRANRKSEFLLHDAEFLASLATMLGAEYRYPHQDLRLAWELVCLNQFHDIIPGSSIGAVYKDSQRQYTEVRALGEGVSGEALAAIADGVGGDLLLINPTSFARRDLAYWPCGELPDAHLSGPGSQPIGIQPVEGGLLLDAGELPPYSVTPLSLGSAAASEGGAEGSTSKLTATPRLLENDLLRVEFNDASDICRIYDKTCQREILPAGTLANQLQIFEDRPKTPDAWEIDINYDDKMWTAGPADSVRVVESGPLRATLKIVRQIQNSEVVQRISLAHNSPRLDFATTVQWRERHIMLKAAFPVDVLSPQATYEIQWGNVQRPTHRNTSWDWARFETCAQKWVDLSEGDYGVSLLNDCKYGHDIRDNVIRLTLLRSPTDPDPQADLGEHHFAYGLLPHVGGWDERTISQAYALNDPIIVFDPGGARASSLSPPSSPISLLKTNRANVVIETVKKAEDGEGFIVRLYESQRRRGDYHLTTSFPLAAAWRTNLLEENQEPLEVDGCHVGCAIGPYQIVTLRLMPAEEVGRIGLA